MAKKIIIDFSAQPVVGFGFSYVVEVDGYELFYNVGVSELSTIYIANGDTPSGISEIALGANLEETIQRTYDLLINNYINSYITYSIVDNTIEVLINADADIFINVDINENITAVSSTVEPSELNLIYYLIYGDYRLNIYKENYLGTSSEIHGTFTLKKSSVENILDPIRGTGLELSLEANSGLTFDEFLLSDEFTYKTELLKNGYIIFEGYIKPDGVQQSYISDQWYINIESVDGLGLLKDLSFVQENGTHFTGKMSFFEIIEACLNRTHLTLDINTSINLEYEGYAGSNILKDVYVNSERFIKNSNDIVIMDCNEVLTSVLNLFSGVITQQDGKWWIYRPNDLELNGYTTFINQTTNEPFTKNLNAVLGSQIDNFYPHHCDSNQQIEVKGAISAYRLNYQYGFLEGYIGNPNLNHDIDLVYEDWTVNPSLPSGILLNNPLDLSGVLMKSYFLDFPYTIVLTEVIESTPFSALQNDILTFKTQVLASWYKQYFLFKIKTSDGYFLNINNDWELGEDSNTFLRVVCGKNASSQTYNLTFELEMPPLPTDSDVSIVICRPYRLFNSPGILGLEGIAEVTYCQISDYSLNKAGIVGENHTVTRLLPPSSITKENQKVFNGDGDEILIGSIYKADLITPTETWSRVGKNETFPLLGISAMDDLRIQSNPCKVFSGSVFGEIPYMSVVTINNVTGLFMPIEYDYDYKSNKSNVKLMQFYNSDLGDIQYEVSPDYGNSTIKPTIVG